MELWVRSQDKDILMKAGVLEANDDKSIYTTNRDTLVRLGKYKSKERALEILDEIEELDIFKRNIIVSKHFGEIIKITYEMPEE